MRPLPHTDPFSEAPGEDRPVTDLTRSCAVLVVDTDPPMRSFLRRSLERHCALLEVADNLVTAEAIRKRCHFDLIIADIPPADRTSLEWLQQLRVDGIQTDFICMAGSADLDTALDAFRTGAADLIVKPFRTEQLLAAVRRCIERSRMARENFLLRRTAFSGSPMTEMVGSSASMRELFAMVARVAPTSSTILIEGETGVGKELVASAIHRLSGRGGEFVPLNCGSISPELLESELFGHTRGAFTGAHASREGLFSYAHEGTLFLDEISELPPPMQVQLLRVIEQRSIRPVGSDREIPVDVRVLAATNRPLLSEVREGRFRRDLFYRLNVLTVSVPSLRERPEDIPELAAHFSRTLSHELGLPPVPLTHADIVKLQSYSWPGNVRELRNVIERSLLLGKLPAECCHSGDHAFTQQSDRLAGPMFPLDWTLREVERHHSLRVLQAAGGNKSEAARRLGVSRKTLERKLKEWHHAGSQG